MSEGNQQDKGKADGSASREEKYISFKRRSSCKPTMEDVFRRELKFFFMDPCSKWRAKGRCPLKLCVQVVKILLVTIQVWIFAGQRSGTVDYFQRNKLALKHIFLKDWEASFETMPYPPAVGKYAVYTKQNFYDHMKHIIEQYYKINSVAIGTFYWEKQNQTLATSLPPPMQMCKKFYTKVKIFENNTFIIDPDIQTSCFEIHDVNGTYVVNIEEYLHSINQTIVFDRLISLEMNMIFRSYHLDILTRHSGPACFRTAVTIAFNNAQRDGQMLVDLTTIITESECDGKIVSENIEVDQMKEEEMEQRRKTTAYDSCVMIFLILSSFLCLRSLFRAIRLRKDAVEFISKYYDTKLSLSDQMEFVDLWYVLIVINDVLTLVGSAFKIMLQNKKFSSLSENYDLCSILLGVGSLMAWTGVLRYLRFLDKYNILIKTLKTAFPSVLKFMVCALILYLGFMFCGWVILGPHHIKFRDISTSSECLFSLLNGDDMFVTFSATQSTNPLIWYFGRAYLYIFISLFIYIILNLFMAVITDTYETLTSNAETRFPKSDFLKFIDQCNDSPSSGIFDERNKGCCLLFCFSCCNKYDPDNPDEKTSLMSGGSL